MKKTKINIGIVGLGRIGKMHAKNICQSLPLFNLKSIADPDPNTDFTQNLEDVVISDNIDNVLSDKKIEGLVFKHSSNNEIIVNYEKKRHKIEEIINIVKNEGVKIIDLSTDDGDLEDVFINITKN